MSTSRSGRLLALAAVLLFTGCRADLRPESLKDDASSRGTEAEGRALLLAAAEKAGGIAAWREVEVEQVKVVDTWQGFMGRLANPWPNAAQAATRGAPADGARARPHRRDDEGQRSAAN